jgi:AcrR family transcriptional regulator
MVAAEMLGKHALASRERMKKAARQLINRHGYSSLRVEDITTKADLAKGLFYRYFKDRYDITLELCRDVFAEIDRESVQMPAGLHPFEWFNRYVQVPIRHFCENPGLLACMFELHGEFSDVSEAWKAASERWNRGLATYLSENSKINRKNAEDIAFVLAAMMEGIIYQDLVRNIKGLQALGKRPEAIAEIIAIVWYRTIFLELPPPEKVHFESRLLRTLAR